MDNMAATESYDKRMQFRKQIRNRYIQSLFKKQRIKYMDRNQQYNSDENIQNISNYQTKPNQQFNNANLLSNGWKAGNAINRVQQIINVQRDKDGNIFGQRWNKVGSNSNNNHNGDIAKSIHLKNQAIRKIWHIVLQSQSELCLSDKSMQILISNAEAHFNQIANILQSKQSSNKGHLNKSQRLGQILWILLNQCYKNPTIPFHLASHIIHLTINLLCLKSESSNRSNQIDEYIIGLCVILLGNVCVSEMHVQLILKQVKLSKLVSMLDGMLDVSNQEDLSFVLSNMLYYYPHRQLHLQNQQQEMGQNQMELIRQKETDKQTKFKTIVTHKQQMLELIQVLSCLYTKLYSDLLLNLSTLSQQKFEQHKKSNIILKSAPQHRTKTKNQLSHSQSKRKDSLILSKVSELSQQQQRQLRISGQTHMSQNYTNDLMQCAVKVKQVLHEYKYKQPQFVSQVRKYGQQGQIKQLDKFIMKLLAQVHIIQNKVLDVALRVLLASQPKQYFGQQYANLTIYTPIKSLQSTHSTSQYLRHRNVLVFIRDIYRSIHFLQPELPCTLNLIELSHNQFLQELILNNYSTFLIEYCHRLILLALGLESNHLTQQIPTWADQLRNKINMGMQIWENIQGTVWELYTKIIDSLKRKSQGKHGTNHKQFQSLFTQQIQWIELKLISSKSPLPPTYESKLICLLSDIFPIIQSNNSKVINKKSQARSRGMRDSIVLRYTSEIASENSQSQQSQYQFIEVNMEKVGQIFSLLECKIREYQNCDIMLLTVLRAVQNIVQRIKTCFEGAQIEVDGPREISQTKNSDTFPIRLILGQSVYKLIGQQLVYKYEQISEQGNSIQQQISSIIAHIMETHPSIEKLNQQPDQHSNDINEQKKQQY